MGGALAVTALSPQANVLSLIFFGIRQRVSVMSYRKLSLFFFVSYAYAFVVSYRDMDGAGVAPW